jgi:hypothetical protein
MHGCMNRWVELPIEKAPPAGRPASVAACMHLKIDLLGQLLLASPQLLATRSAPLTHSARATHHHLLLLLRSYHTS